MSENYSFVTALFPVFHSYSQCCVKFTHEKLQNAPATTNDDFHYRFFALLHLGHLEPITL